MPVNSPNFPIKNNRPLIIEFQWAALPNDYLFLLMMMNIFQTGQPEIPIPIKHPAKTRLIHHGSPKMTHGIVPLDARIKVPIRNFRHLDIATSFLKG